MRKYFYSIFSFLLLFLLAGLFLDNDYFLFSLPIDRFKRTEQEAVKKTVQDFNNYFMDVYASVGAKEIIDSIPGTTEMRHRMFKDVGFFEIDHRALVYDLADFTIENTTMLSPFTAEVITAESWNYAYENLEDRKPASRVKGMDGKFRYLVVKKEGRWLVQRYRPLREQG